MVEIHSVSSPGGNPSPAHHQEGPADWGPPIPESYGQTRLTLLPRDPRWMFSYWEITENTAREIKSRHGENVFSESQPTLRRIQVRSNNGSVRVLRQVDTAVALEARNWYLQVEEDGSTWYVELGLKRPNGEFILIVRSNYVRLPRGRMSSLTDERWGSLRMQMEELLTQSGGKSGAGSMDIAKKLAERWEFFVQTSSWISSGGMSSSSLVSALRKS